MTRYTPQRKAEILDRVARGRVSAEQVMIEHQISAEELAEWQRRMRFGTRGLRATRRAR